MEGVHGDVCVSRVVMKREMTMVGNGQQMSAAGQQVLWSADHVISLDNVPTEQHNDNYKKKQTG